MRIERRGGNVKPKTLVKAVQSIGPVHEVCDAFEGNLSLFSLHEKGPQESSCCTS